MESTRLQLRGMSCASCAKNVENAIISVAGVSACSVNFGAEQATVEYDARKTDIPTIQAAVSVSPSPQGFSFPFSAGYLTLSLPAQQWLCLQFS